MTESTKAPSSLAKEAPASAQDFELSHARFVARLSFAVSFFITIGAGVIGGIAYAFDDHLFTAIPATLVFGVGLFALWLHHRGRSRLATTVVLAATVALTSVSPIVPQKVVADHILAYMAINTFAAFLISPRASLWFNVVALVTLALAHIRSAFSGNVDLESLSLSVTGGAVLVLLGTVMILIARLTDYHLEAHRRRLVHNKALFAEVPHAIAQLEAAAHQIAHVASRQREGAVRQASAVSQTRSTLASLLASSSHIVEAAHATFENSSTTLQNAEQLAESIRQLTMHTQRISSISHSIRELAGKSDLLALNASLEGVKAGDAGRGFSLVANQMQRLAEGVTMAVRHIKDLTANIDRATASSTMSTEVTTKLAKTTNETAQQINLVAAQQQSSVEQVAMAMDDIADISQLMVSASDETISSSEALRTLAGQLAQIVTSFRQIMKGHGDPAAEVEGS